ncbi:MAG: Fe-S cluster assembly protein SufD [Planctomycetes bacterium]|nr:Fe-S cluster assembly protein SufD [Planctomycetota bacterium]
MPTVADTRAPASAESPLVAAVEGTFGGTSLASSDAYRRLLGAGVPTQKDEAFRYVSLRRLRGDAFRIFSGSPARVRDAPPLSFPGLEGRRVTLVNGRHSEGLSTLVRPASGFSWIDAEDAADFGTDQDGCDFFSDLNGLVAPPLFHIDVPPGTRVEEPVHLVLRSASSGEAVSVVCARVLVTVGEGASLDLVTTTDGVGPGRYLADHHLRFELAPDSTVRHFNYHGDPDDSFFFHLTEAELRERSSYSSFHLAFGGHLSRVRHRIELVGEGASAALSGAEVLGDDREHHKHIVVHHRAPACRSHQHFKTILGQNAVTSYDGAIVVEPVAQKTDAYQLGANLVLSDTARAHVKPALYIGADDVKCSHGATVGQIEEEELLYVRSRGIPLAEARRMLVFGFAGEVLEAIDLPSVRAEFECLVGLRLAGVDRPAEKAEGAAGTCRATGDGRRATEPPNPEPRTPSPGRGGSSPPPDKGTPS